MTKMGREAISKKKGWKNVIFSDYLEVSVLQQQRK